MRSEKCIALITVFILKDRREYKEITSMAIYVRMNANKFGDVYSVAFITVSYLS